MIRLLLLGALIAAAIVLWRRFKQPAAKADSQQNTAEAPPMVRCAHCHVHVPRAQALNTPQGWFCSQAHFEAHHAD
ncbi:hypothetical protein MKI83_11410 [Pseudomonas sp. A3.4]|nr:hypothetical protein [Atopomonas sediminilitoris]